MSINLYISVYNNLERELVSLAEHIHFDDKKNNQLAVYSIKISELLIRTSVEIESISKELYYKNGGPDLLNDNENKRDLYFDTDCLDFLEKKWRLSERLVYVSAHNFYFSKDENKILNPLYQANIRGKCDWKKAYQSVKHDRMNNLEKANIKNLIIAMAALYLLNIYYSNETGINSNDYIASKSFGSNVFSVKVEEYTDNIGNIMDKTGLDFTKSTYIRKYIDSDYKKAIELNNINSERITKNLLNTKEYKEYVDAGNIPELSNLTVLIVNIGRWYFEKEIHKKGSFDDQKMFIEDNSFYQKMIKENPHLKKEITVDNIINVAQELGQYELVNKYFFPYIKDFFKHIKNIGFELVINKGQSIYSI